MSEDEGSAAKLKTLINEALKNSKEAGIGGGLSGSLEMTINQSSILGSGNDKLPMIEVLLNKNNKKMKSLSPIANRKSPSEGRSSNLDETRTNIDKNAGLQKDIFESKDSIYLTSIGFEIS